MRFRRRVASWAASCVLLAATPAAGHLRYPKLKAERVVELRLSEDPIRISYRIGFGAGLAKTLRSGADRNGDLEVSAAEGNAALDARTRELLRALTLCTGDVTAELQCRPLGPDDVVEANAQGWKPDAKGHLHLEWLLDAGRSATDIGAIRFEDAYVPGGVEVTEVTISEPRHVSLQSAGADETPGVSKRFTWIEARRPPGPRYVVASWAPPRRMGRAGWLVLTFLVIAGAGLGWKLSSRRKGPERARAG